MNERPNARRHRLPNLPPFARGLARLVVILPLLALLIASGVYFAKLGHLLRANFAPIAAAETGRQIHHDVRLGSVQFAPGALVLSDVAVSNRQTWQASHGEAALTAKRIVLHYNLHSLLFDSGNAAHAIGDIDLDSPRALIERFSNTSYNFSDLLKPRNKKPGKPFVGQVIVHHGILTLRDYVAPARLHERPAINTLYGVNTTVSFHSERYVYFDGTGQGRSERLSNVAVRGDASRQTAGRYRVFARISDADARYWSDYFKAFPQGRILAGRANLDLTAAQLDKKPASALSLDLLGRVNFSHVSVALTDPRLRRLPLQNIGGTAIFTGAGISVDGTGLVAGQPVAVSGTVFDLLAKQPQLSFAASSERADPAPLERALPTLHIPPGVTAAPARVTAQIAGAVNAFVVSADVQTPRIAYQGNAAEDVRARVVFANNVLSLPVVQFRIAGGGTGNLRATINTQTTAPTVMLGGRVASINLASLRLPPMPGRKPLALGGLADASFLTRPASSAPNAPLSVVANVSVTNPRVARTVLKSIRGRVAWAPGANIIIRRAVVDDGHGGFATVSGQVPTTPRAAWNLAVNASGANMAALLAPYSKAPVSGVAYAQARVTGFQGAPLFAGQAQVYGAKFAGIGLDAVSGTVSGNLNRVTLSGVTLRRYPAEACVAGTVTDFASGNPALALSVSLAQGDVQDFLTLARTLQPRGPSAPLTLPDLTGTAQGRFQVAGRLRDPQLTGQASVTDATVGAYRIDSLRAALAYKSGTVRVENAVARAGDASATARGQFNTRTGRIAAAVQGQHLSLDLVRPVISPYADVKGVVSFSGTVGGTVRSPSGAGRIAGTGLAVNGEALAPLTLAGRYADGVFTKTAAPWTLAFLPATTDTEGSPVTTPPAPTDYVIDDLRLTLPTPAQPQRPLGVRLTAHVPDSAPERVSRLVDTVRASVLAHNPAVQKALATFDALPVTVDGDLSVPALTVTGTANAPHVAATLVARNVTAGADNGAARAQITGTFTGGALPSAQATVSADDLRLGGVPVQSITAQAGLSGRVVTVSALDARAGDADLHAEGRADLDGPLTASLDASNVPLALLNGLIPQSSSGAERRVSGTLSDLSVQASGLTRAPTLVGSLNLDEPTLELGDAKDGGSRYALDSIRTGAVTLSGTGGAVRLLTVNDLAAFKNGRPVATLSGTLPLNFANMAGLLALQTGGQPLHAELKVADLSVLTLFIPTLIDPKRTGGALTAAVDVGADQTVQGRVDLANASVGLLGFDTGLTKIGGRVLINGSRVTVQSLAAQSTKGGTIAVSGGGTLTQANLQAVATGFAVDEAGKGTLLAQLYGSGGRGKLDGRATLTGPWMSPRIATAPGLPLVVSNASGTLAAQPALAGRIAQINVVHAGGGAVSTAKVLSAVSEKVGEAYDPNDAQRDLSAVRNLGYFGGGVKLTTERGPTGGINLTYTVAESAQATFDPQFDIAAELGGGKNGTVSVRSSLLQADARGDVHLGGTMLAPTLQAHLAVARGQFYLPPSTLLRIVKPDNAGENIIDARYPVADPQANNQPGLETRVNLTAQATVSVSPGLLEANTSAASPGVEISPSIGQLPPQNASASNNLFGAGSASQRYKITAHISGLLNVPDKFTLDLTSSPPGLTRQQMLAALVQEDAYLRLTRGGGSAEDALKTQLSAAFSTVALPTLLSPIEQSIANTFGLEDFSVDYSPDAPVLVTLSKQLLPRLTATYTRGFGARTPGATALAVAPPQYTLKLGYGFSSHFQFSVSTDDQRNNTAALEGIFGF